MSNFLELSKVNQAEGDSGTFLVRWRGRQEGPYSATVIENKLAANQIGLLHEILHNGQWVTIRDYITEKENLSRAQRQAQEREDQRAREEAERQARERDDQQHAAALSEEKRKNELLLGALINRQDGERSHSVAQTAIKPHRGSLILTYSIIGLLVCFPFSLAAWSMGSSDIQAMDAGLMDPSGRSLTSSGRVLGILGTILWLAGIAFYFSGARF